jgi:hypothetical protein
VGEKEELGDMQKPPVQCLIDALQDARWDDERDIYTRAIAALLDMEVES